MTASLAANERTLPVELLSVVQAVVAKLNKRAAKLGVEPFVLSVGNSFLRPHPDQERQERRFSVEPVMQEVVTISITGAPIKVADHEMVGRVDFEDGMILVNTRPGGHMPESFRATTPMCQHCNSERKRNSVFVFLQPSGSHIQVGRSCLVDFLGHSPEHALWAAREWIGLFSEIDEECEKGMGRSVPAAAPLTVLAAAVRSVREFGFLSRAVADERGTSPTSSDVSDILFNDKISATRWPTEEDFAKAKTILDWVKEAFSIKANPSDYEHNALLLCEAVAVKPRRIGLLASLVAHYHREMEERVVREKMVNDHVGTVGERRDFEVVYRGETVIDTMYGSLFIGRFQSDAGLLVYKGGSPFWPKDLNVGDALKFKGTVKEHDEYKGTKQTLVSRCKVAA